MMIVVTGLLTAGGTSYITYSFTKSKYKQEVEKLKVEVTHAKEYVETTAIENDIKLSGHYKEILDDLKARYETRYKEFEEMMTRKILLLEEELKLKDRKIKLQQQEITELKKENRTLRNHARNSIT
ncbi:hypothetical protein [Flavobacterium hydrocarbonoxydans]|nr:hypothetical protein [Flavobacterium hydrocarbonoxydans]